MDDTTTHEPFPLFEDGTGMINVTTHLGTNVYLHCRVSDLNGKTVSLFFLLICPLCMNTLYIYMPLFYIVHSGILQCGENLAFFQSVV